MEEKNKLNIFPDDNEDDRGISTEKLNKYISVGSTGGFILIGALVIAVISLLIWGFTGTIPVTITEDGVVSQFETESHSCICFVDVDENTGIIPAGKSANVRMQDGRTFPAEMTFFSISPFSAEELKKTYSASYYSEVRDTVFSDWMMDKLLDNCNYAYLMIIETEDDISDYWHQLAQITVVVGEVRPISFLFK